MYGVQYHCAADTAAEGRKCQRVTWGKPLNDAHWNVKFITMDSDKNDQTGTNALNTGLEAIWEIHLFPHCSYSNYITTQRQLSRQSHYYKTVPRDLVISECEILWCGSTTRWRELSPTGCSPPLTLGHRRRLLGWPRPCPHAPSLFNLYLSRQGD